MEIVLIIVGVVIIGLLALQLRNRNPVADTAPMDALAREMRDQNALLRFTQEQSSSLRQELAGALKNTSDVLSQAVNEQMKNNTDVMFRQLGSVEKQMQTTTENLAQNLKASNEIMNTRLESVQGQMQASAELVNKQLDSVTQRLQESTGQVGSRLDTAARVIGEVQKSLGFIQETTGDIKELHELLSAPKLRGGFGEEMLEDILKQSLPAGFYEMQYRFKSGAIVDAVIKTASHLVPIDAKFPYENFKKFANAEGDAAKKAARKDFDKDVRKHIDDISNKYILPDEGTFGFALMYIPAENVYYEIIIKDEQFGDGKGIFQYATERKIVPVSPNNLFAYLQVIALGLKGMQIEKNAKMIQENLARLQIELDKFNESFKLVGRHLGNAKNSYDDADKRLDKFEDKLALASQHDAAEPSALELLG